jgi:putative transcriptional regulator
MQQGDLLVAPPQIRDPRFSQAVILMAHSSDDGDWGLCLNRSMGVTVTEMLATASLTVDIDQELYWGGPVSQGVIWMLHDSGWQMPQTIDLTDQWSMTSHRDMFNWITERGAPLHWRMFSGFSAWAPGQLAAEMQGEPPWTQSSSWLICQGFDPQWAFDQDDEDLWRCAISLSGQQAVSTWL